MPQPQDPHYRAFLSYSHRDEKLATWLHRKLEAWPIARDLVGRETRWGPVPRSLRPVFRDRDDFSGGASLMAATQAALEASAFLIVLCSPNAVVSIHVNEEIRLFKKLGRAARIIPVIIAGEPGDPGRECFPPALVGAVDLEDPSASQEAAPIAADLRDEGDGRERAAAKVVAGLLGVGFDKIVRRAERAERRRKALIGGVAVAMTALAVLAVALAIYSQRQRDQAVENFETAYQAAETLIYDIAGDLRTVEGVRAVALQKILGRAQSAYEQLASRRPDDTRFREGRVAMLQEFYLTYMAKYDFSSGRATVEEMLNLSAALLAEEPDSAIRRESHAKSLICLGAIARAQLDFEEAETALSEALELVEPLLPEHPGDLVLLSTVMTALHESSLIRREVGDEIGAVVAADRMLKLANGAVGEYPDDGQALMWLGAALTSRAALTADSGAFEEALVRLTRAKEVLNRALGLEDHTNNETRDMLADTLAQEGVVLTRLDRHAEGYEALKWALIRNLPLVEADPDNLRFAHREAFLYTLMGEAASRLGRHEDAQKDLTQAKERWELLVLQQLGNPIAEMPRLEFMLVDGQAAWRRGDRQAALETFEETWGRSRDIVENHGDLLAAHLSAGTSAREFADYLARTDTEGARGVLKEAIKAIEGALTKFPEEPLLLDLRADLQWRTEGLL